MATTIKLKNSVTTTNAPSSLAQGEVAINVTDKKVWVGNAATTPVQLLGTGSDGSFTNLTVSGTTALNGGATLGDASGDALTINSSAVSIPNGLNFDSNTFVIDATNNRVGVGIASPDALLQVSANNPTFKVTDTSTTGSVLINPDYFSGGADHIRSDINHLTIGTDAAKYVSLKTNDTERMRIDSSGNVGIGTSSPDQKLDVRGSGVISIKAQSSNSSAQLTLNSSGTNVSYINYGQTGANPLAFYDSNAAAERMRIDSSGNVGIGTSNAAPANGKGMSINGGSITRIDLRTSTSGDASGDGTSLQLNGNDFTIENREAGFVAIATSLTERMRIDSSGKLLVGGTSTSAGYSGFNQALIGASAMLKFQGTTNAWDLYNNGGAAFIFSYNASDKASINQSTGAYTALSDVNKKKDFEASTTGLNAVMQLKPTLFRMIDDVEGSPKQLGFIAQEVQTVIPQAYVEQEGGSGTFIGLQDRPIIAALTKAIQEQQAIITSLTTRLEALENK